MTFPTNLKHVPNLIQKCCTKTTFEWCGGDGKGSQLFEPSKAAAAEDNQLQPTICQSARKAVSCSQFSSTSSSQGAKIEWEEKNWRVGGVVGAGVEKRGMFMGTGLVGQQCQCHPHTRTPTPKPRSHFLLIGEKQSEVEQDFQRYIHQVIFQGPEL